MDTNHKNPNNKGLGWIPDYPDLRDYRLDSGDIKDPKGRLKREDRSKEVEQIAQEFTNFVESFSTLLDNIASDSQGERSQQGKRSQAAQALTDQVKKLKTEVGNQVDGIQLAIFGDISFESVNVYKQLRQGVNSKLPFSSSSEFLYESDVTKRIVELKNCLYFIFISENIIEELLNIEEGIPKILDSLKTLETLKSLKKPGIALKWLKEESFDDDTARLVRLFQHCADIWIDGIVGLETYTAVNEYLEYLSGSEQSPDSEKLKFFKNRFKNFKTRLGKFFDPQECNPYPSDAYQPQSHLLPVSLLLPREVFKKFLNKLEQWAIEELFLESSEGVFEDVFEKKYLKEKLKVTNPAVFEELFFEKLIKGKTNPTQEYGRQIEELSKIFFGAKDCEGKDGIEKFIAILQKEFLLIEPIVAAVVKILMPLAKFRDDSLENIVSKGLAKFEQILICSEPDTNQRSSRSQDAQPTRMTLSNNARLTDVTEEFSLRALKQVQAVFDAEIEFKIRVKNKEKENEADAILYFYFLIQKAIRRLNQPNSRLNELETVAFNSQLPNPFEKQEIFEVVKFCPSKRMEFFKIPSLQIPLKRKLIQSLDPTNAAPTNFSQVKQYLFLPSVVDLSYWCSEIEDQGSLNSCTALAGVALLEYFTNRSNGRYTDASSLFLYKATRDLMDLSGDVGASVRETMKAIALFGIPPEQYWQYDEAKVDEEPPSFCYSFAQNYQALKYFRLDYAGISKEVLLAQIKVVIATSFPCIFGFTIYTSAYETANQRYGLIPFPDYKKDRVVGGHSVVAVGYDDYKKIERKDRSEPSEGAFLIRNSFGDEWGDGGYGWLPYDYVLAGLTADWWSLLKAAWFSDDFWQGVRGSQGPVVTDRQG